MDKQLIGDMTAILETLAETTSFPGPGAGIASHLYLALGSDLERFETVKRALVSRRLVTATSGVVTITEQGRAVVAEIAKLKAEAGV